MLAGQMLPYRYIPGDRATDFLQLATLFDNAATGFPWLYSATVYGLFDEQDVLHPNGMWLWGPQRRAPISSVYRSTLPLIHPVKFSNETCMHEVVNAFEEKLQATYPERSSVVFPVHPTIPPPASPPCTFEHETRRPQP